MSKIQQKNILVIEDDESVQNVVKELLELLDYSVLTASNGENGIEQALTNKPDAILCDVMMPTIDGFEVLQKLKANAATRKIPFIFLTAKAESHFIERGLNSGAVFYVTKPFTITELSKTLEAALDHSYKIL